MILIHWTEIMEYSLMLQVLQSVEKSLERRGAKSLKTSKTRQDKLQNTEKDLLYH